MRPRTLYTFTDFTSQGPYLGLMHSAALSICRDIPLIDLMNDVPAYSVRSAACLLNACSRYLEDDSVVLAVVDPGVGSDRDGLIIRARGHHYVGPDNGLFDLLLAGDASAEAYRIVWRPERLSSSFHGRDLFAPVAASLATGKTPEEFGAPCRAAPMSHDGGPFYEVIYLDGYGNAMTGIPADALDDSARLAIAGCEIPYAETFSQVPIGEPFWFRNSLDLVEIAINQGDAARRLDLAPGSLVETR